jgi:hypothetical protein
MSPAYYMHEKIIKKMASPAKLILEPKRLKSLKFMLLFEKDVTLYFTIIFFFSIL